MNETSRSSSTLQLHKIPDGYPIERKVINPSGRLGSLYDASTDNLIDQHSADASETKTPHTRYVCRVFSGDPSRGITSYLKDVDYDDALRQSICLHMMAPQGICRLVDYKQPINENTRFLYYCYRARKEWLEVTAHKTDKLVAPPSSSTIATHMITKIVWGFEFLCVVQIPTNHSIDSIDQLLENLCDQLKSNRVPITIKGNNQYILSQLKNITIFGSNRSIDQSNASLLGVLSKIKMWQKDANIHQPLVYQMQPLRWLYGGSQFLVPCSFPKPDNPHVARIEILTNRINNQIRDVEDMLKKFPEYFPSSKLDERSKYVQLKYRFVLDLYGDLQKSLWIALADIRRHRFEPSGLDGIIADQKYHYLRKPEIEKFIGQVEQLLNKSFLLDSLKHNQIEYINAFDVCPNKEVPVSINDIDVTLKETYSATNEAVILWYASDRLKREEEKRFQEIYRELASKQQIKVIYVDFTNIEEKLEDFMICRLPSVDTFTKQSFPETDKVRSVSPLVSNDISSSVVVPVPLMHRLPPTPKPSLTEMNVLLVGETSFGTSMFINAFANYLKFENFQEAEQGKPIILIPVSFSVTVADQFDDLAVRIDSAHANENVNCVVHSVSGQYRSYVFELNTNLLLRFIDASGISGPQSKTPDMKSIEQIANYISGLSNLSAICLFHKPNITDLSDAFNFYVKPLLNFLTTGNFQNILFCMTNTQRTSNTTLSDNVDQFLKTIFENERPPNIPIRKENTFCFNNEAFQYLTARKCGIQFNEFQKYQCIQNWNTSTDESLRLLSYIQQCKPYDIDKCFSIFKFGLDLAIFARAFMETLRLIIYNWKLNEAKLIVNHMELKSNPIDVDICTNCALATIVELDPFRLVQYQVKSDSETNISNLHDRCSVQGKHFLIESDVIYEFVPIPAGLKNERWQSSFYNFLFKCDQLHHFIQQQESINRDDPFQSILDRYIEEEQFISQTCNFDSTMNKQVYDVLVSIKRMRQDNNQKLFESNEQMSLRQAYEIYHDLLTIPTVRRQVESIKKSRRLKMAKHERLTPKESIRNTAFLSLIKAYR